MKYVLATIMIMANMTTAQSHTIQHCTSLENNAQRLICFDKMFPSYEQPEPDNKQQNTNVSANWQVTIVESELSANPIVTLINQTSRPLIDRSGDEKEVVLIIRCKEEETIIAINYNTYLGINAKQVALRLDDQETRRFNMNVSTNKEAVGFWSGKNAVPLIRDMYYKSKLTMGITPYNMSEEIVSFNIAGLRDAIEPLAKACSWNP